MEFLVPVSLFDPLGTRVQDNTLIMESVRESFPHWPILRPARHRNAIVRAVWAARASSILPRDR